jgi:LmbE family N-acetylglucosaminyl deacetylase
MNFSRSISLLGLLALAASAALAPARAHAEDVIGDIREFSNAATTIWPKLAQMPELKNAYPNLPQYGDGKGDVFMIFAHSDDELTLVGALAHLHRVNPSQRIHWIMVSDNQAGKTIPGTCLGASKADCRAREAGHVAVCTGLSKPVRMGFQDGGINLVPDLQGKIAAKIDELREGRSLAAIFSSDETGLYGHPDHMAVHDATSRIARTRGVPFISVAMPEYFKSIIPMRPDAKGRVAPPITHKLDLDVDLQARLNCANDAYVSQAITVLKLRAGMPAALFHKTVHREFFNLTKN